MMQRENWVFEFKIVIRKLGNIYKRQKTFAKRASKEQINIKLQTTSLIK